ncbi:MAG: hypothetical protein M1834_009066 [Cirrosporium novae-zelandiae]|nr:MAG: hypothetical protein M1834_009066 [Cirrosporium novae-zelandiae]
MDMKIILAFPTTFSTLLAQHILSRCLSNNSITEVVILTPDATGMAQDVIAELDDGSEGRRKKYITVLEISRDTFNDKRVIDTCFGADGCIWVVDDALSTMTSSKVSAFGDVRERTQADEALAAATTFRDQIAPARWAGEKFRFVLWSNLGRNVEGELLALTSRQMPYFEAYSVRPALVPLASGKENFRAHKNDYFFPSMMANSVVDPVIEVCLEGSSRKVLDGWDMLLEPEEGLSRDVKQEGKSLRSWRGDRGIAAFH